MSIKVHQFPVEREKSGNSAKVGKELTCKSSCEQEPRHKQGWLHRAQVGPDFCPAVAICLSYHKMSHGSYNEWLLFRDAYHLSAAGQSNWVTQYLLTVSWSLLSPTGPQAGSPQSRKQDFWRGVIDPASDWVKNTLSAIFCENTSTWLSLRLSWAW